MFRIGKKNKKGVATFFLLLLTIQNFFPVVAFALTSGPAQPEMKKFQPAGAGDMVDLFSGDFKYEIPLMDVGGYPLNLAYHSGEGMEDEASWVGMGWSLNPGAVNRTMRGIPDDFSGKITSSNDIADKIKTISYQKDFHKIGGSITVKPTFLGFELGSVTSLKLDVYKDNYYGIGAEFGAGVNFDLAKVGASSLTAGLKISSDPRSGVTLSPSLALSMDYEGHGDEYTGSLSGGLKYNTRAGLQEMNLGLSFDGKVNWDESGKIRNPNSNILGVAAFNKYFGQTYTPTLGRSSSSTSTSFDFDFGPQFLGTYVGIGGKGYITTQTNLEPELSLPAFGYMNYAQGRLNSNAILDFNREKEGTYIPGAPAIPIPVSTEDYFMASSQAGVQQFRPFYNGEYTVFDRTYTSTSNTKGGGVTFGAGNGYQIGGRVDLDKGQSVTRRWTTNNNYTSTADPAPPGYDPVKGYLPEAVYFKRNGEQTLMDPTYYDRMDKDITHKVSIHPNTFTSLGPQTEAAFIPTEGPKQGASAIQRVNRDLQTSTFSYLTAREAAVYGLDKQINGLFDRVDFQGSSDPIKVHKAHHISEVTVTEEGGKRMVYGIPVYNTKQEEVSFSVAAPSSADVNNARKTGLISYTPTTDVSSANGNGRFHIYNRKSIPPYATSYLLTGILSSDYVDKKGDGITDDDLGTAVKFNYKRMTAAGAPYKWRAPYEQGKANYNEGFLSDGQDDKASYVYGEKELWYMDVIVSKTLLAKFWTSPRNDGYGVIDENGGLSSVQQVQKLDSIQLWSRADLAANQGNAVPIKVVHFEYDYSLYPGVTNNTGVNTPGNEKKGKLTLKKVYFTFGASARGQSNPYLFSYDDATLVNSGIDGLPTSNPDILEQTDHYTQRQTDRWGTYKQSYYNRLVGGAGKMNNSEFPYSLQPTTYEGYDTRKLADRFASKWQMTSIITPTGGVISLDYESDDYSYVQDRRAMEMYPMVKPDHSGGPMTGMIGAEKVYVKLPVAPTSLDDFKQNYLGGPNGVPLSSIAFKVYTDIDNRGHYEYVYGYAEIDNSKPFEVTAGSPYVGIPVKAVNGYNPISKAAWQMLQNDLPQLAYESYDNSNVDGLMGNAAAAVRSIVQAFINFRELGQSFDQTASGKHFADRVDPDKSSIRLNVPVGENGNGNVKHTYGKLGGGSRVHKIQLSDNWKNMTGGSTDKTVSYGIQYDYTTTDDAGRKISSGVAAYEPAIGNEENPFHEPVNFTEKIHWSQDRYHFIEKPFGESYFPAPEVGYSEVKASNYGIDEAVGTQNFNTGYTLSRYYTAKDFPTRVDYLPVDQVTYESDLTLMLFAAVSKTQVATSQGFKVTLNDMHGKPKFAGVYDNGGALLSSTESFYSVRDDNAQQKQLNNTVLTMAPDGTIDPAGKLIGTDEELVTDVRESNSKSGGTSIGLYPGGIWFFLFFPFLGLNPDHPSNERDYHSVSTIKVIHQYGLLQRTRTTQNGSTMTADNLLRDGLTGQVLVTRSQNEFDDYTYAVNYPAYMGYDGMSGAYRNIGALFPALHLAGGLIDANLNLYFAPGDELINVDPDMHIRGWIIPRQGTTPGYHLVDESGNFITTDGTYRLLRSGRRNMLDAGAGTVVTMNNPLVLVNGAYQLQAGVDKRVLDAKAVLYKDEWDVPVGKLPVYKQDTAACLPHNVPGGQQYLTKFLPVLMLINPATNRRYIFSYQEDNVTLATLVNQGISNGLFDASILNGLFAATGCGPSCTMPDLSQVKYYLPVKTVTAGKYVIHNNDVAYVGTADHQLGSIKFSMINEADTRDLLNGPNNTNNTPPLAVCPIGNPFCSDGNGNISADFGSANNPCQGAAASISNRSSLAAIHKLNLIIYDLSMVWQSVPFPIPGSTTLLDCIDPVNQVLNPYYQGVKGNWHADYDHVYQVNRVQKTVNPGQNGATNIRSSGYYDMYTPFWSLNGHTLSPLPEVLNSPTKHKLVDDRWEWTSKPIHFDQKGNAVESVDPLKRYSAALYGYDQSLPTAVAGNARHNEVASDGFEDYYFQVQQPASTDQPDPCPMKRHFEMGFPATITQGATICSGGNCLVKDPDFVHSGNYSLSLSSTISIQQSGGSINPPDNVLGFDAVERYKLLSNEQAAGFSPVPDKWYLFSVWVKDASPASDKISGLQVTINGSQYDLSQLKVPVVEGWKKLDIKFQAKANFTMQLTGGGGIYIDDLRILPMDGEMKTFVYDDQTLRLVAQLDENNFCVFYEYDEEGTPIRTKKETERGIMTIKENRQSFRTYKP